MEVKYRIKIVTVNGNLKLPLKINLHLKTTLLNNSFKELLIIKYNNKPYLFNKDLATIPKLNKMLPLNLITKYRAFKDNKIFSPQSSPSKLVI